ncbi:hypothetical protein [Catellatospora sichuanensis]|uniref:hypothetical protein n=1 Tax=Catellatospora sichuanensis TaxID=1969805 RepID=UPI001183DA9F|nr:hypothetical protein [Catellatospora sichuanensis]
MVTLDGIDWARLFHAQGQAVDLPARLAALCGADQDAAGDAFTSLWPRIFAGGALTPATAPVVRHVVAVLHESGLGAGDDTIREGILFLLREIARATADANAKTIQVHADVDETVRAWLDTYLTQTRPPAVHDWADGDGPGRVLLHNAIVDCFDLLPEVFEAVWPIPAGWPAWTRTMAAAATTMLVRHPQLSGQRAEVIAYHQETARVTADRGECATLVFGLGELGVAPRDWLDDPRLAVRTCAALAPALADDPTATEVLVRAAEHPRAFDHSFTEPFVPPAYRMMYLPQLQVRPCRVLIHTVCDRVDDFRRLLDAALAAVDLRGVHQPVAEFGPYLRHAFPAGLVEDGTASVQQTRFADVIAARDDLWDGTCDGVAEMFAAAGLPHDRERWRNVRVPVVLDGADRPTYDRTILLPLPTWSIRNSPHMFLGVARTDPDLLHTLLSVVSSGEVAVEVEGPLRFSVVATGVGAGQLDVGDLIASGPYNYRPVYGVGVAAALSLWVSAYQWRAGTAYRQQFVDGVPAGPIETLGPADRGDGYRFVFELDPEWVPSGTRLPG